MTVYYTDGFDPLDFDEYDFVISQEIVHAVPTVADYLELITSYHRGKPKFSEMVGDMVSPSAATQVLLDSMFDRFDLDVAVGAQLDVDGEWVGRSRYVTTPVENVFFAFDDSVRGFDLGVWYGPYDTVNGVVRLDDETYRIILRAKIAANNWDGTVAGAAAALEIVFPGADTYLFIDDRGDMSMVFGISGRLPSLLLLALFARGYIPLKPAGVRVEYLVVSESNTSMFGFDVDNQFIGGWDTGSWGVNPETIIGA